MYNNARGYGIASLEQQVIDNSGISDWDNWQKLLKSEKLVNHFQKCPERKCVETELCIPDAELFERP